ncbi:uncharacterized protein Z519_03227 [Cladophialophora bantiana CBS 173.52]|uniref:Kinetochore protein fta4 n=1 Tax=Cladophialophora bantiana (strain ATCC 10958 / CBS 173.52 / CDC B-1940 / NIH 8579) TaxID=1442370 RepID=A0A0D2HZ29_CLAB1|nr:uncharacterized protein Z519_03227 [Cladophialophora bantiana CBS 173.52]KIW96160.1 hypothetical protein Z519_03227 [Cladophialophora bantiana CBS 173.52]
MDEPSITALKAAFIRSQVRHLETPLEPSTQWRDLLLPEPTEGHLSDKMIQDLVSKVNDKIKQHNRLIFSTQSQRHVAEQIESLHWTLVSADDADPDLDTVAIRRDADLTDSEFIASLPQDYDGGLHLHPDHRPREREGREGPGDAEREERYTRMREELLSLSQQRDVLKGKLAQYRRLQQLMEPLREPQENIQPNLVTRDGELSQELARMRVLLARVTAQVGEMGKTTRPHEEGQPNAAQTDQQKLARVMGWGEVG